MTLSRPEIELLIDEIKREIGAKRDGSGKNLIAQCPFCNKEGKYGIYVGKETTRKRLFMAHCFSCGHSTSTLNKLLEEIGRPDLMVTQTTDISTPLDSSILFPLPIEDEIDDSLEIIELPEFYTRCYTHEYLKLRGFTYDDYDYFSVGTTRELNYKYRDYVIFPIIDDNDIVGYVARHIWSKAEIDSYNIKAKRNGDFPILRFRNSNQNDFVRLLFGYDSIVEGETETVIIVEGIFDVVALTRKLDLYDNNRVAVIATFGKKISQIQIYKLQSKGVSRVVLGYDGDAVEAIKKRSDELSPYFNVVIADIPDSKKDWEELTLDEIFEIFSTRLKTPIEYKLSKLQE